MTDEGRVSAGWFEIIDPDDGIDAIETLPSTTTSEPADWPRLAVESGYVESETAYYDWLHDVTIRTTRSLVREREQADDQQVKHAVRAMDDCLRMANELAERLAEWGGTTDPDAGTGIDYAREVLAREETNAHSETDNANHLTESIHDHESAHRSLAHQVVSLSTEADRLSTYLESHVPAVTPNLNALAGPILAARLISLAGSLESLAKKPSGTVQVLGAEEALFAHLRGHAPSPKHGIIYTHDAVRGTRPDDRGSAARALAGKLTIAARIDHYSGERRPALEDELNERIATIQSRGIEANINAKRTDSGSDQGNRAGDTDSREGEEQDIGEDGDE